MKGWISIAIVAAACSHGASPKPEQKSPEELKKEWGPQVQARLQKNVNPRTFKTPLYDYLLRAQNVEYYLFDSPYETETKRRRDAVDAAVLQYRIRRVLERPDGEGAFRSGPDASRELLEIAGTRDRALAGLRMLTRDPDAHVRERATSWIAKLPG